MTTAILNLIAITAACSTIAFLAARANRYKAQRDVLRREAQTHQARIDFREGQIRRLTTRLADLHDENDYLQAQVKDLATLKALIETGNRSLASQAEPVDLPDPEEL